MVLNPTPPRVSPTLPGADHPMVDPVDPLRPDRINPNGRARPKATNYSVVAALVALALLALPFFMRREPATLPSVSQTTGETTSTQPETVTPTQPETTTPTQPVPMAPIQA